MYNEGFVVYYGCVCVHIHIHGVYIIIYTCDCFAIGVLTSFFTIHWRPVKHRVIEAPIKQNYEISSVWKTCHATTQSFSQVFTWLFGMFFFKTLSNKYMYSHKLIT